MRALYTARIHVSSLPPECFPHACAPLMINANSTDIRERERERDSGGSRERREIGYFNFDSNAGKPLLSRRDSALSSVARFEWMRSMGAWAGEGIYKRLASSVSKWLLFVSCRWKNFVNNHARVFGLKRSRDFFRPMERVCIVMRGQYGAEIANFTKWSTNLNDIQNFFAIKDAEFDLNGSFFFILIN